MADFRECLRLPIPEIGQAALRLDDAVTAHLAGDRVKAAELFRLANDKVVWDWVDSVWGKKTIYNTPLCAPKAMPSIPEDQLFVPRHPNQQLKAAIHQRDGYYCLFCGIPVIRDKIRDAVRYAYPEAVIWGGTNATQHAAFQCLWAQYDHVFPWQRGGTTTLDNLILTCSACNYGKGHHTLEEMGLRDPRLRPPRIGSWDGLERFLQKAVKAPSIAPAVAPAVAQTTVVRLNPATSDATLRTVVSLLANSRVFLSKACDLMADFEREHGPVVLRIGVTQGSKFKWPSYRIDDAATGKFIAVFDGGTHKPWSPNAINPNGQWSTASMTLAEVEQLFAEVEGQTPWPIVKAK